MELLNETPFEARLVPLTPARDGRARTCLIVKRTFDWSGDDDVTPSREQEPIHPTPQVTTLGLLGGDVFPRKKGVDICVTGTARLPHPEERASLSIRVGARVVSRLEVFGERRWLRRGSKLEPSPTMPFSEMPLTYARAFGGTAKWEGQTLPWPDNPNGVGLYLAERHAEGNALPNIESPEEPLRTWNDRPRVVGWAPYPATGALRVRDAVVPRVDGGGLPRISPALFNTAHPDLIVDTMATGNRIEVEGMRDRVLRLRVPAANLGVTCSAGATTSTASCDLDGVFLHVDADKVVTTHRVVLDYVFRAGEQRRVVLH